MRAGQQSGPRSASHSLWLSRAALSFVALAAVMGWGASFVGLHAYGQGQMVGFSYWTAWLVPGTFDGAAFGATLITYRASIYGRSAMRGRMLMWSFTAISSWINWIHQISPEAQIVAAGLPIAAVAVFDVVLAEMRADFEERHGKRRLRLRPGLLFLRWIVDRTGTGSAFRRQVTDIPVSEIAGLATQTAEEQRAAAQHESAPSLEAPRDEQTAAPSTATAVGPGVAEPGAAEPGAAEAGAVEAAAPPVPNAGNPATSNPATGNQATGNQVAANRPSTTPYPAAHAPTTQPASGQTAADQHPTGHYSSGTQPAGIQPAGVQPAGVQSAGPQSPETPSSGAQSATTQPTPTPSSAAHSPSAQPTPERPASADDADDEDGRAEPTGSAAQAADAPTVMLPPVPASPLNELSDEDKRTFARRDYRLSMDTGTPLTGADLGRRYGYSERWGRRQIAAVRVEDREGADAERVGDSAADEAADQAEAADRAETADGGSAEADQSSGDGSRHLVALRD